MKNILPILFFLFSILSFSQIIVKDSENTVVGSVKRGYALIAELSFVKKDSVQIYTWKYLDAGSMALKSIKFESTTENLNQFYLILKDMLKQKNGTIKEITVGDNSVSLTTQKIIGFRNILITVNESSYFGLNGKEINKLFGK